MRDLAGRLGLDSVASVRRPTEPETVGDDFCRVLGVSEALGDGRERYRSAFVVRDGNHHYDGFHPDTWVHTGGWNSTPRLVETVVVQTLTWEARDHRLVVHGDDPPSPAEVRAAFAVAASSWRPRDPDGSGPPETEALDRIGSIGRPHEVWDVILPPVAEHQGDGHRLAAMGANRDAAGGHTLVVCFEPDGVQWVGDLPFQRSVSTHRCPPGDD